MCLSATRIESLSSWPPSARRNSRQRCRGASASWRAARPRAAPATWGPARPLTTPVARAMSAVVCGPASGASAFVHASSSETRPSQTPQTALKLKPCSQACHDSKGRHHVESSGRRCLGKDGRRHLHAFSGEQLSHERPRLHARRRPPPPDYLQRHRLAWCVSRHIVLGSELVRWPCGHPWCEGTALPACPIDRLESSARGLRGGLIPPGTSESTTNAWLESLTWSPCAALAPSGGKPQDMPPGSRP